VTGGEQSHEAAEGGEIADLSDLADIVFEVGLDVGAEPELAMAGSGEDFGVASVEEGDTRGFGFAHGKELQDQGAAGHGFGDALHEGSFLRAGEEPVAGALGIAVDEGADVVEEERGVLNFIEDGGFFETFEKGAGVALDTGLDVGVFEEDVFGGGEKSAEEIGFTGSAGAGEDDGWIAFERIDDDFGEVARYRSHG